MGISFNATVEDFRQIAEFAQALDIKLPTDRETGRSRGFGFIEFNTPEECQRALASARVEIHGREVVLAQSQPREPGMGGGRGGRGGFRGGRGGFQGGRGGYQGASNNRVVTEDNKVATRDNTKVATRDNNRVAFNNKVNKVDMVANHNKVAMVDNNNMVTVDHHNSNNNSEASTNRITYV